MILTLTEDSGSVKPDGRKRVYSQPCLPERLPTTSTFHLAVIFSDLLSELLAGVILREAESLAPKELTRQLLKQSIEDDLMNKIISEDEHQPRTRTESLPHSPSSITSLVKSFISPTIGRTSSSNWENLQVYAHLLLYLHFIG